MATTESKFDAEASRTQAMAQSFDVAKKTKAWYETWYVPDANDHCSR